MTVAQATNQSLGTIVADVGHISELISQITRLSEEQAESIAQVTTGIGEIASVVQANSATSEESAAAAQELSSQAHMLQQLVSVFKLRK
jgi:methyl-accepting chemotaxis protein